MHCQIAAITLLVLMPFSTTPAQAVEAKTAAGSAGKALAKREKPLEVGDLAPNFRLKDQHGEFHSLEEMLNKHDHVAAVFYRSAGWCPFCRKHLVELQQSLNKFSAANTQLVGLSYDGTDVLKKFSETSQVTFPLLSDTGSKTIHAYGVHHKKGYPYPGTYLIGKDRKILAALFNEGYRNRHEVEDLLKAIRKSTP